MQRLFKSPEQNELHSGKAIKFVFRDYSFIRNACNFRAFLNKYEYNITSLASNGDLAAGGHEEMLVSQHQLDHVGSAFKLGLVKPGRALTQPQPLALNTGHGHGTWHILCIGCHN